MGTTIQEYRSRIGNFMPFRKKPTKNSKSKSHETDPTNDPSLRTYLFSLFILLAMVALTIVFTYPVNNSSHNYSHPLYPDMSEHQELLLYRNTDVRPGNTPGRGAGVYSLQWGLLGVQTWASSAYNMISNFQSRYTNGNRSAAGIRIGHWNKGPGHLRTKMPEIKNIINDIHPHLLGISEANLSVNHDKNLSKIEEYTLHTCPTLENPVLQSSRVVVYTHKSLVTKVRRDLMCDSYSSIWLEVGLPRHKKFLVCQTYREWQLMNQNDQSSLTVPEQLTRWNIFLDQWVRALDSGLEVHVLGDLNINHCNWTDTTLPASNQTSKLRPLIQALFTFILPHGVSQCVLGPTRHWPGQVSSGLDHYYTNKPEKLSTVSTRHCGGSDHMLIFATRYSRSMRSTPRYIRKRCYKNFNAEEFVAAIKQVSWLDIYLAEDVNTAVTILSNKITFILDTLAPMKTIQVRTKYAPWLSKHTIELMKERNRKQKVASETKCRDDWKKFKALRNQVNNRLKYEESKWNRNKLEECDGNPSKTWKRVKNILNWKSCGSPSQLFYKGRLISKPQELADVQNLYFIEKINLLRQKLPPSVTDPLQTLRRIMQGRSCTFSLTCVHPDEVDQVISNLSNSSSFGMDMIDTFTVKLIKADIIHALTHIINLSITTRTFPNSWKKSKVVPLYKKDDVLNPKNYRPVAILPVFSKVLERVIFNQVVVYISENNLIHPSHHAYRSNHNTTTALIQMYDIWLDSLEKAEMAGLCFLDMSAAFDIVDHSLLIKKLELYGFESSMVEWVSSYLTGRSQCVSIDGSLSRSLEVSHGVPQGSILGPLLYTIFTNELPEVVHANCPESEAVVLGEPWPRYSISCTACGSVGCYADDTTYSCSGADSAQLSTQLSTKYNAMSNFLTSNRLKLNDEKTHLMVMSTSQARTVRKGTIKDSSLVVIRTPSKVIEPSESEKLLGCWLHEDMKFSEHIVYGKESVLCSLNQRIGALKLIARVASFKTRKMIANGIFMSKLIYLIELWGGSSNYLLKALQKSQNRAARFVTKLDWGTSTSELLKQCGWLSVHQLAVYHSVVMVYKVILNKSPKHLYSMFSAEYSYKTNQAHNKMLRHTRNLRLNLTRDSFRWRAARNFNQLPLVVKNAESVEKFKNEAKSWILKNIPLNQD